MRIYIAAPLIAASLANAHAERLTEAGFAVSSTWHAALASVDFPKDPESLAVRRRILDANLGELVESDRVLVDTTVGMPRATFAELGYALGIGLRVVWIEGEKCIFDAHANVTIVGDMSSAIEALR